jgi:hypothetical protein
MSMTGSLRKGLKFLLMSFGISTPEKKPKPVAPQESARKAGK